MTKYVGYYRVSTKQQGNSGLGLLSQKDIVKNFIDKDAKIIAEYTEIDSGNKNDRPELMKAIDTARKEDAKLVIAKLDRLSRNMAFIFTLRDSDVEFVCADMPELNTLSIGIFASMAQYERELISERTKKALAEKKRQGFKLGNPQNFTNESRMRGRKTYSKRQKEKNKQVVAFINSLREQGIGYKETAKRLNDNGFKTSRGNQFFANSVRQLLMISS